jgi:hypothetical protein
MGVAYEFHWSCPSIYPIGVDVRVDIAVDLD